MIARRLLLDGRLEKRLKRKVMTDLVSRAQGMFRWVVMSLESLQHIKFKPDFEMALGRLPPKLSDLYDIVLTQIEKSEQYGREVATKTLKWLLCAQRLLTVDELAAAVLWPFRDSADSDSHSGSHEDDESNDSLVILPENDIIRLCRNLVVLDAEAGVFRFAHQSVREYLLLRHDYTVVEQHIVAAERCLDVYLDQTCPGYTRPGLLAQNSRLELYAQHFWPIHCKEAEHHDRQEFRQKFMDFMIQRSTSAQAYRQWASNIVSRYNSSRDLTERYTYRDKLGESLSYEIENLVEDSSNYLRAVSTFGFGSLIKDADLSSEDCNQELKDSEEHLKWMESGRTDKLLNIASRRGHSQVVEILLARGADINALAEYDTALHAAIERGHISIVKILLDHGADANIATRQLTAIGKNQRTPLATAIQAGHDSIVGLLLENGAHVNVLQAFEGATHLLNASDAGFVPIVQMLLDYGADTNLRRYKDQDSPLIRASGHGHEKIVKLLIEHGSHVDEEALNRASGRGQVSIAKPLLQHKSVSADEALIRASENCRLSIVNLLLQHGADVRYRSRCYPYFTALSSASKLGFPSIVQALLEKGADLYACHFEPNLVYHCHYRSAFNYACEEGHTDVVRILIEKMNGTVDFKAPPNKYALDWACLKGHHATVQLLLEEGTNFDFKSALHAASRWGHWSICQILIEKCISMNNQRMQSM